jgi:hypothetical protein
MKVYELIEALNKCNKDFDVFCGWEDENRDLFGTIINVSEYKNIIENDCSYSEDGVYIGIE